MHCLDDILAQAQGLGAHDIHLHPPVLHDNQFSVSFRQNRTTLAQSCWPREQWELLRSFLQFHSGYRYEHSENFQDRLLCYGSHMLRLAFTPGREPYITLRVCDQSSSSPQAPIGLGKYEQAWRKHGGFLLIAGPVHSGKTTLYYELLNRAAQQGATLSSWEDPIEQHHPNINQHMLARSQWGQLAVAALRFDWDLVGIGEVRQLVDLEHLLFLSLSSVRTITTLHAASLNAVSQKLRRLPQVAGEQVSSLCCGVLFREHYDAPLQWSDDF